MDSGIEPRLLETERCILGIALMRSSLLSDMEMVISPNDFYDIKHAKIFRKMLEMRDKGEEVNTLSLLEAGVITQPDLVNFMDDTFIPDAWLGRCQSLKRYSIRRQLCRIGTQIQKRVKNPEWEVTGANVMAISNAVAELCPPEVLTSSNNPFAGLSKYAQELREMGGIRFGTGIPSLDRYMAGGILPGESINIVGAQGSMKTSLALQGAKDFIKRSKRKVLYLCIDPSMSQDIIRNRLLQSHLNMDSKELIDSIINGNPSIIEANEALSQRYGDRLLVIEGGQDVQSIGRLIERERPGAVIYDYLSAISGFRNDYDLANVVMKALNE